MEKLLPKNKEKYTGVRFEPECLGIFRPNVKQKALIKHLIAAGKEFGKLDIKDENGGNLSVMTKDGMIIKNTGAYPFELTVKDFSLVVGFDGEEVYYFGKNIPSSESRLHWSIYTTRPDVKCVLHCHDFLVVLGNKKFPVPYIKEMPYGTLALAKQVSSNLKDNNYLIEKNHGVVAVGKNVNQALTIIKKYHASAQKTA